MSMSLVTWLALLAVGAAAGSMIFAGMQTRISVKQTAQLKSTAELSFGLDVMARLQKVLFEIAKDPQLHERIWGEVDTENDHAGVAARSLLDVLALALAAVDHLPGFARNKGDWASYSRYVLKNSPNVLDMYLSHPEWWPEIVPYVGQIPSQRTEKVD